MKFSEVLDSDMKMLGQLINMLQVGSYSLNGKDVCASADTIRWLQQVTTDAAKVYKESKTPKSDDPSPSDGEGFTIKSMGKAGKK